MYVQREKSEAFNPKNTVKHGGGAGALQKVDRVMKINS